MKKTIKLAAALISAVLVLSLGLSASAGTSNMLILEEDWHLTEAIDVNAGDGNVLYINGINYTYTIYEMNAASQLTNSTGTVWLQGVRVVPVESTAVVGNLAAISNAAYDITTLAAPAQDATTLSLPTVPGYTVNIQSTSNVSVITLDGTVIPPPAVTTVDLTLTLTGANCKADTRSFSVVVPARSRQETDLIVTVGVNGKEAVFPTNIIEACKAVAAVYDENNKMLGIGLADAAPNQSTALINLTIPLLPGDYTVKLFLLGSDANPLRLSYTHNVYTKTMFIAPNASALGATVDGTLYDVYLDGVKTTITCADTDLTNVNSAHDNGKGQFVKYTIDSKGVYDITGIATPGTRLFTDSTIGLNGISGGVITTNQGDTAAVAANVMVTDLATMFGAPSIYTSIAALESLTASKTFTVSYAKNGAGEISILFITAAN